MKKSLFLYLILISFSFSFYGCLSEEEIQSRQDNAFDLSGLYETVEESQVSLSLKVINEDGVHDIYVILERKSDYTKEEEAFLSKLEENYKIHKGELLATSKRFVTLGKESGILRAIFYGGDNVSSNFGKTSKFNICSKPIHSQKSNKVEPIEANRKNVKLQIEYCLSGEVNQESKEIIRGELSLQASMSYETTENGFGFGSEGGIKLKYTAQKIKED